MNGEENIFSSKLELWTLFHCPRAQYNGRIVLKFLNSNLSPEVHSPRFHFSFTPDDQLLNLLVHQ